MRDLSSTDLQCVSGGNNSFDTFCSALLPPIGIVLSTIGYGATANKMQQLLGVQSVATVSGAAYAAIFSGGITYPLWTARAEYPENHATIVSIGCMVLGASVGIAEGIIKAVDAPSAE